MEAHNSVLGNNWETNVEIMVICFLKNALWHVISVFKVLELLISFLFKMSLIHVLRCTESIEITRQNVGLQKSFRKTLEKCIFNIKRIWLQRFHRCLLASRSQTLEGCGYLSV